MADDLTAAQAAQVVALVDAQARARGTVTDAVLEFIRRVLGTLSGSGWYEQDRLNAAAGQIAAQVRSGQVALADVTASYLDRVYDVLEVQPPRDRVQLPEPLRPVDPMAEWQRPAGEYRRLRVVGLDEFEAAERALRRAEILAQDDLALAAREASRQRLAPVEKVTGYRRVLRPELSTTGVCGLCIAASDRVYSRGDLLPLHGRCKCEVLPIVRGKPDPGRSLNRDELAAVYEAAGSTGRQALARVRYKVVEHGELGPQLREQGDSVRGPREAARQGTSTRQSYDGEIAALERTSADLQRRKDAGEDVSGPLTYQRERLATLRQLRAEARGSAA